MNSEALTKIQSVILTAIIVLAAVGGAGYVLWQRNLPPLENIRIGICADIDSNGGRVFFRGATLAAEQINVEGGILGRNITIVTEDDDSETPPMDIAVATNALTRLITIDKADYIISGSNSLTYQDICSEHKKIFFNVGTVDVALTQRVADNYDKYKYYFRYGYLSNSTAMDYSHVQALAALKNASGLTKIGYLLPDVSTMKEQTIPYLESKLPGLGFEIVYRVLYSWTATTDFTSYFARAEDAKAEILFTILPSITKSATLVNEWYERQSPLLLCGDIYGVPDSGFWNTTGGRAEFVLSRASAVTLGYPFTSKIMPAKEAFLKRWGVPMKAGGASAYDIVRFILADAIRRAGTTETEAVIRALEGTNVETTLARRFAFTSSHDILIDEVTGMMDLDESHMLYIVAQWQNGTLVPVYPGELRIEAGGTYKFPPWQGAWSK